MGSLTDKALRIVLSGVHRLLRLNWFVRRPRTFGAHALALTPDRKVILVKLRYARGWRLPGGGRREEEDPSDAVLRELREEIGMTSHGEVRRVGDLEEDTDFKRDLASLLIVEDVRYRSPKWSWEVEQIIERRLDDLPPDLAPIAADWIREVRGKI